jgi:hypothetical protein
LRLGLGIGIGLGLSVRVNVRAKLGWLGSGLRDCVVKIRVEG